VSGLAVISRLVWRRSWINLYTIYQTCISKYYSDLDILFFS
jgi:hypothetical protein